MTCDNCGQEDACTCLTYELSQQVDKIESRLDKYDIQLQSTINCQETDFLLIKLHSDKIESMQNQIDQLEELLQLCAKDLNHLYHCKWDVEDPRGFPDTNKSYQVELNITQAEKAGPPTEEIPTDSQSTDLDPQL